MIAKHTQSQCNPSMRPQESPCKSNMTTYHSCLFSEIEGGHEVCDVERGKEEDRQGEQQADDLDHEGHDSSEGEWTFDQAQSQQNRYGYAHTHTQTKPLGMSASSAENLQSDIFAEQYIPFSLLNFFVSIGAL